jgi:hypothetical protein
LSLKPTPGLETVMEEFYAPGRGLMDAATKEKELRSAAAAAAAATTTTTAAAATATRRPPRRKVLAESVFPLSPTSPRPEPGRLPPLEFVCNIHTSMHVDPNALVNIER